MKKVTCLKEINKRLPEGIILKDETNFEFTDDEFISILSWIQFFNGHYKEHGKEKHPSVIFPIISKRLRLDFGLYRFPSDQKMEIGKHVIYISENGKLMNGDVKKNITIKGLINTWQL